MNLKNQKACESEITLRLDAWMYYGFHVLVVVLPLIITYQVTYDQFDLVKSVFLRIITVFLLLCFVTKSLLGQKVRIRRTSLDYPIIIFLALILVSTIFSVHPVTSIFGKYKRYEGLITYVNYGVLFFLAAQFFDSVDQIRSVAYSMVISAAVVSLYGLLQHFGLDFLTWHGFFEPGRSFSTLGNPVLLGGYLVILLPVSLSLLFSEAELHRKIILGVSGFLVFSCLVFTFSRGAWLGGFFALIGFFLLSWKGLEAKKPVIISILVFLMLTITLLGLSYSLSEEATTNLQTRISEGISLQGSAFTRIEIWKSAVKMIEARPILGFGPDCFRLVFQKYQTLEYARFMRERGIADNAHNYFLQLASTVGIPAAFAFIAIIGLFILSTRKILLSPKSKEEQLMFSAFVFSILGYLLHLIFSISVVGSTTFLWLILGMTAALTPGSIIDFKWDDRQGLRKALLVAAVFLSFLLIVLASFPLLADFHFASGNDLAEVGYYDRSVVQYEEAIQYFPYVDSYYCEVSALNMKWAKATKQKAYFDRAVVELEIAARVNPSESDNYLQLAEVYLYGAEQFDSRYYDNATTCLREVLTLEPYAAHAYYLLGASYFDQGRFEEAVRNLKRAVEIGPAREEGYFYLGSSYEKLGQEKEAIDAYRKVLSLNSKNQEAKEALSRVTKKQGT